MLKPKHQTSDVVATELKWKVKVIVAKPRTQKVLRFGKGNPVACNVCSLCYQQKHHADVVFRASIERGILRTRVESRN